jgi:hypothetical protein
VLRALALAGLLGIAAPPTLGLTQQRRTSYFVTLAVGPGSLGFSALLGGSVQRGHAGASLRLSGNLPPAGRPIASDIALLATCSLAGRLALVSVGAGVAAVFTGDSTRIAGSPFNKHTTIGLPLEARAVWRPVSGFGVGLIAMGNVNSRRSYVAALLGLQLGRFE